MRLSPTLCLLGVLFVSACAVSRPYVEDELSDWQEHVPPSTPLAYRVFLIGDAGDAANANDPVLKLLGRQLRSAGEESAVVFLGDNIYCCGLPDSSAPTFEREAGQLRAQLRALDDYAGRVFFIPGNHDWNNAERGGLEAVERQERFVERYLGQSDALLPDAGFPGPHEVKLTGDLRLIALDTQWWLHRYDKRYGDAGDYEVEETGDVLLELDDLLRKHRRDKILVVGHHPLLSNGRHAGFVSAKDHFFPLTVFFKKAYVPLPVFGSLASLYVRSFGGSQDLAHPRYRTMREALMGVFEHHDGVIYASGHDHNLQLFRVHDRLVGTQHYIVSGAGSRPEPVAHGHGALFASGGTTGFVVLDYYDDGSVWMEAWQPEGDGSEGTLLIRTELEAPDPGEVDPELPDPLADPPDYTDSTVVRAVNPDYERSSFYEFWMGSHHREVWATAVEVPVLDLGEEAGGLTPVRRGGGFQSTSIRLDGADGYEYVLRSIDKDPSKVLPPALRSTIAADVARDQTSSQHPFGAFVIPPLAEAAGVYHSHPKPVFVPDDPRLGAYRDLVAGDVVLFEQRADDDVSEIPNFGGSDEVISTADLYRAVTDDNDFRVDSRTFLRARLFDMLLADWDRHEDQWRWASFEPPDSVGKIYKPIPRDRDQAFARLNGVFPSIVKYFAKYQDFRKSYGNLRGLTTNGINQDHRFLAGLDLGDWRAIADSVVAALSDSTVEAAFRAWPDPIFDLHGEEMIEVFKTRRDKLPDVAETVYRLHARSVNLVGSNKHERFEVTRLEDGRTEVVMLKTNKEGEVRKELLRRVFHPDETREIILYGLGGRDRFFVSGESSDGIRVFAVGGPGEDEFEDTSTVRGPRRMTRFYDTYATSTFRPGPETRLIRSVDPDVNRYSRFYHYNTTTPIAFFGANDDDGLFVGGGVQFIGHGFRKEPYARLHRLRANFSARTLAFNADVMSHYVDVLGAWDILLDAQLLAPNSVYNFYGLGNDTPSDRDAPTFYETRLTRFVAAADVQLGDPTTGFAFRLGPRVTWTNVRDDEDRFSGQPEAGLDPTTFDEQLYAGVAVTAEAAFLDRILNPRQGARWEGSAQLNVGASAGTRTFSRYASTLSVYLSPLLSPQTTLALRIGGSHIQGSFPFYEASTLGGRQNLRGFRRTRFAGRSSAFANAELRLRVLRLTSYLATGEAGLLGFYDTGRVWADANTGSDRWHAGYGGGLWISLFERALLAATLGFSEEDTTFSLGFGFLY